MISASLAFAGDTTLPASASAYERGIALLAAGKQAAAEHLIEGDLQDSTAGPEDKSVVEEVFFAAVCRRSRFEVEAALPLFAYVDKASRDSSHGQAARLIMELDRKSPDVEERFLDLDHLSAAHPDDPLLLWMVAVQCRSLEKREIGVERYKKLCEMWRPAPVLVHQTYANLLDELNRYDEALVHRQIAIKLERAGWAYQGMGNTLTMLHRWQEADDAFQHATELQPESSQYWRNWAYSMELRGDKAGAAEKAAKAVELEKARGAKD